MKVQGEGFSVEMFDGFSFQAWGEIAGRDFFFRGCRHEWTFEIANDCGKTPADGGLLPDEAVDTEFQSSWYRTGTLDKWSEDLTEADALAIIRKCVRDYKNTNAA